MFKLIKAALLLLALLSTQTPAATTVRYQHTDILGSVVAETDAAANIISRSHYEPFGKRSAGDKAGISYTGHLQDEDLNLIYMQQRYYDPVIGRFYSNDPVGFTGEPDTFNRYSYVANNPYKYTDPTGEAKYKGDKSGVAVTNLAARAVVAVTDKGSPVNNFAQQVVDVTQDLITDGKSSKGRVPGPTVDKATNQEVGRFIVDSKGNTMIEPVGGKTVPAGKGGVDTHTVNENGSNYQRLNPQGHANNPTPHGHGHLPGTGPGIKGQGPSITPEGNVVPRNSPEAHCIRMSLTT